MDLSAVIFVVLALAWAVYLIPKALQHHDEMASDRLVEGHSERVRILRRKSTPTETVEVETETVATEERRTERAPKPELSPAGVAARRRRRVLAGLVLAGVLLAVLAHLAYVPWWSTAVPVVMIAVFLVIARRSVRSAQRSSLARRRPVQAPVDERVAMTPVSWREPVEEQVDVDVRDPEPAGDSEVLADDGSLWDPLPMTLPTYVNKARARRTVRTIELTGMQSSGHDHGDSALAREAETTAAEPPAEEGPSRRVAGA